MFDLLGGLPLHPLVVHGVVVLFPLPPSVSSSPPWARVGGRASSGFLFGVVAGAVGSYIAKVSGDSLSAAVGLHQDHADWGNYLLIAAMAFSAITGLWVFTWHLQGWAWAKRLTDVAAVITGVAVMVLTYQAGHSGAQAVWAEQIEAARQPPASAATITGPISIEEVGQHATPEDCWSVVNDSVYDLTGFIDRHPAGAGAVIGMCGRDATEAFIGEHGGQAEPEDWLAVFRIGTLAR